jgi:uncharacterized membrane protein
MYSFCNFAAERNREMNISRIVCCWFLVTVALVACLPFSSVLAQEETIELEATHPRVESDAPEPVFKFTVTLKYQGDQTQEFDLRTRGPSGWSHYVTSSDERSRVSVIKLEPDRSEPYQVRIIASPPPSTIPETKDYTITLVASSGTIRDSIELTAVVMPTYSLDLFPRSWYHRELTANEDNFFIITAENTGSGELTNIKFSAHKPQGWLVEFQPEIIDRLAPDSSQEVEVNIKPPTDMTDRYYNVTLIAEARQLRQTTDVRVQVEEVNWMWVWIGAGIAVLVIAGFAVIFLRLGRGK